MQIRTKLTWLSKPYPGGPPEKYTQPALNYLLETLEGDRRIVIGCGRAPNAPKESATPHPSYVGELTLDVSAESKPDIIWDPTHPVPIILHGMFDRVFLEDLGARLLVRPDVFENALEVLRPGGEMVLDVSSTTLQMDGAEDTTHQAEACGFKPGFALYVTPFHQLTYGSDSSPFHLLFSYLSVPYTTHSSPNTHIPQPGTRRPIRDTKARPSGCWRTTSRPSASWTWRPSCRHSRMVATRPSVAPDVQRHR